MLGTVIKSLFARQNPTAQDVATPARGMTWPVKSKVAPRDSRLVLGFSGPSRSGIFLGYMQAQKALFERCGYQYRLVSFEATDWHSQLLDALQEGVRCVVAPAGAGIQLFKVGTGCPWAMAGIPFIKLLGDHPAYFPDRHKQTSPAHVNLYAFPEHLDFFERRLRGPTTSEGISAQLPILGLPPPGFDKASIPTKRNGRLAFYKNGNDPDKLRRLWQDNLPVKVASLLNAAADELRADLSTQSDVLAIERVIDRTARLMDISPLLPHDLLCFLTAQLDDYARRAKSTLLGRVLAKYPVDIYGDFWEHVDFTDGPAVWHGSGTYQQMMASAPDYLALIDMSPNTVGSVHERVGHAAIYHTLCLTNATPFLADYFPEMAQYAFDFNLESVSAAIEKTLARPQEAVAAGYAAAESFARNFPDDRLVNAIISAADLAHARLTRPVVQNFCIWSSTNVGVS